VRETTVAQRERTLSERETELAGNRDALDGQRQAVTRELERIAPVMPDVRVSALGSEAVVHGCLAAGTELAWQQLTATIPVPPGPDDDAGQPVPADALARA